ncbi:MAG: hypothetical protein ACLFTE_04010 [Salinivenus sp.]
MTKQKKQQLFQFTFGFAALLYLWSLYIFWEAPGWLSGTAYFFMGILPALCGVVCLAVALGLHMDIQAEDE